MASPESSDPWDWMQPHDVRRLGEVIADRAEQERWCRAILLGGLPYMWRHMGGTVMELMYEKLALRESDKVLLLGESISSCGFDEDIRKRIGPKGEVRVVDVIEKARDLSAAGKPTVWRYDYTSNTPDEYYDCVAVLQGVAHTDDWRETGKELLRVMKSGRNILLGEIGFSPKMWMAAEMDIHIEYWLKKIFSRLGRTASDLSYYSTEQLQAAFAGMVVEPGAFVWKGIELFWATKPPKG